MSIISKIGIWILAFLFLNAVIWTAAKKNAKDGKPGVAEAATTVTIAIVGATVAVCYLP